MKKQIPRHLTHKPIVWVDYKQRDLIANPNAGDAEFLSIGRATWFDKDCSVKVWRKLENGIWSRQAEELPIYRLLDMCILFLSKYYNVDCCLGDKNITEDIDYLEYYLASHKSIFDTRISEIKRIIVLANRYVNQNRIL